MKPASPAAADCLPVVLPADRRALVIEFPGIVGDDDRAPLRGKVGQTAAFLWSPRRAAVTALPIVMLDVIKMNVISAMKGMLKTSDCLGQGVVPDWRRNA